LEATSKIARDPALAGWAGQKWVGLAARMFQIGRHNAALLRTANGAIRGRLRAIAQPDTFASAALSRPGY